MTISIDTLFSSETIDSLYRTGLQLFRSVGILVTSWRTGDPTATNLYFLCEALAKRDVVAEQFIRSGFLSTAKGDWKRLVAKEVYGVNAGEASYSTPTCTLANSQGGLYPIEPGDITVKSSLSNVTFHNTNSPILQPGPGTTCILELECDVAGSDGTVGANEIDNLLTPLIGVSIASSTAAVGLDEQDETSLQDECDATLGALSPNGPGDAYRKVALDVDLTGAAEVVRAATSGDTTDGTTTVWLASATGGVAPESVTAVQAAVDIWATPQCITPTAASATEIPYSVAGVLTGADLPADYETLSLTALQLLTRRGRISTTEQPFKITLTAIEAAIHDAMVVAGASNVGVALSLPAADVTLSDGQVATLADVTVTRA